MITERLRHWGLGRREVMDTTPVSVHYEITEFGRSALGFDELRKWSEGLPQAKPMADFPVEAQPYS